MKVQVSPVARLHPVWQYVCPIRTPAQLLYFVGLQAAGIAVAAAGLRSVNGHASLWPLVAIPLAVLPSLVRFLPGQLDLAAEDEPAAFAAAVRAHLAGLGYRFHLATGAAWVATGGGGWGMGRDGTVRVLVTGPGRLRVEGPAWVLRSLRRWAVAQDA